MVSSYVPIRPRTEEDLSSILSKGIERCGLSQEILAVCEQEKVKTVGDLYELSAESLVATDFTPSQVLVLRKLMATLGLRRRSPNPLSPSQQAIVRRRVERDRIELLKAKKNGTRNYADENARYSQLLLCRDPVERAFARQMLVIVNEPGVRNLVYKFASFIQGAQHAQDYSIDMEDLLAEGNLGLLRGAEEFDPRLENRFFTYAVWWVRHRVQRYLLDCGIIRVPVNLRRKVMWLNRMLAQLPPGATQAHVQAIVCEKLELKHSEYTAFRETARTIMLLIYQERLDGHRPHASGDDLGDMYESVQVEDSIDIEEQVHSELLREDLGKTLEEISRIVDLPDRSKNILLMRYGFCHHDEMTLEQIGQMLGISRERVRQLEASALEKLRATPYWADKRDQLEFMFGRGLPPL